MKHILNILQITTRRSAISFFIVSVLLFVYALVYLLKNIIDGRILFGGIEFLLLSLWIFAVGFYAIVTFWGIFTKKGKELISEREKNVNSVHLIKFLFACLAVSFLLLMLFSLLTLPVFGYDVWLTVFGRNAPLFMLMFALLMSPFIRHFLE